MTKRLVIHADDFGRSREVNEGILSAIERGGVTSTSLMVNFPASDHALELAVRHPIDLGWHINLTEGFPITPPSRIPSLVRRNGSLHPLPSFLTRLWLGQIAGEEVERELEAQMRKIVEAGLAITHLDGHHHIQAMPVVREVVRKIVAERRIPFVRVPKETGGITVPRLPARLFLRLLKGSRTGFWEAAGIRSLPFYGLSLSGSKGDLSAWRRLLAGISDDTAEVMVHLDRPTLLSSPEWRSLLREGGFELTRFRDLPAKNSSRRDSGCHTSSEDSMKQRM